MSGLTELVTSDREHNGDPIKNHKGDPAMRHSVLFVTLTLCCTPLLAQNSADGNKEEGFEPLFDGKSFAGWRVSDKTPESWKVENGLLILTGGRSHLFTKDQFEDFVVRFEWRPVKKGYNSGFFVRGRQIQMAQGGAGMLFGNKQTRAVPKLHKPPGQWNAWEVTCAGPKLSLKVNGKPAWEIGDFKPARRPLGFEAEGHAIEFRHIRIKRLGKEE